MQTRALIILLCLLTSHLWAQQPQDPMTPILALSFPLKQEKDFVSVRYPVLLEPTQNGIIMPGTQLITIVQTTSRSPVNQDVIHQGDQQSAYARDNRPSEQKQQLPTDVAEGLQHAISTPWLVTNNFVLAMAQFPPEQMILVTKKLTGTISHSETHYLHFFDGLFLGAPDGKVTIISVKDESPAGDAGLKAGDEITSIGGLSITSLKGFVDNYSKAKEQATNLHKPNYIVSIQRNGASMNINVSMPPRFDFDSNL